MSSSADHGSLCLVILPHPALVTRHFQFALTCRPDIFHHVTQKELVLDAISELPDEVSLDDIAARVEFLAAIQKGLDQLDRGEGIPHDEVKRQLATWLAS